jgi:hypothetical protein
MLTNLIAIPTNQREFNTKEEVKIADTQKVVEENKDVVDKNKVLVFTSQPKEMTKDQFKKGFMLDGKYYEYSKKVNVVATHYGGGANENGGFSGLTASSKRLSRGMIATPNNISFGTPIVLEDSNGAKTIKITEDRGNSKYIKWLDSNTVRIDIYVPDKSVEEIKAMGVKKYTGYIIKEVHSGL